MSSFVDHRGFGPIGPSGLLCAGNGEVCDAETRDRDEDGLSDLAERAAGTDPRDPDSDGDSFLDGEEVLALGSDPLFGNVDQDMDAIPDRYDNCLSFANPTQQDADADGVGDVCDRCPGDDGFLDPDHDGLCDGADSCPLWPSSEGDGSPCLCGDLDDDGMLGSSDRSLYARFALGESHPLGIAFWEIAAPHKCDLDGDGLCTPLDSEKAVALWPPPADAPCGNYAAVVEHALNRTGAGADPQLRRRIWETVHWRISTADEFDGVTRWLVSQVGGGDSPLPASPEVARRLSLEYGEAAKYPVYGKPTEYLAASYLGTGGHDGRARTPGDLAEMKMIRHLYGETPLEETLLDLWFNHLNVFAGDGLTLWDVQTYESKLRSNLWGSYEDLVQTSLESVSMLDYLNQNKSSAFNPNENHARELLELHTLGDGNFDEFDIEAATYLLTGYTTSTPDRSGVGQPSGFWEWIYDIALHAFIDPRDASSHFVLELERGDRVQFRFDGGPDVVREVVDGSGSVISSSAVGCADAGNEGDGELLVCLLSRQPATARRVSEKLVGRLLSEQPRQTGSAADPPPLVAVERAYLEATPVGDLRTTVLAVVEHPDFLKAAFLRSKLKRPLAFTASLGRALGRGAEGESSSRDRQQGNDIRNYFPTFRGLYGAMAEMGEALFWAPAPTGYPEETTKWTSSGAILRRWNIVQDVVDAHFAANPGLATTWGFAADADGATIVSGLVDRLVPSGLHEGSRRAIELELDTLNTIDEKVRHGTALILSSPEFLID
jgi:uncharacterized protein (DUF1800 family)